MSKSKGKSGSRAIIIIIISELSLYSGISHTEYDVHTDDGLIFKVR